MLSLKSLKFFITVCEEGSFSRAAAKLKVTQPAVSRRVHLLEEEIGMALVVRDSGGISLTHQGTLLLAQARDLVGRSMDIVDGLRASTLTPSGPLAVGTPPAAGQFLMPDILTAYMARYPKVSIRIVEGYTFQLVEKLISGEVDIAIIYGQIKESAVNVEPITDLVLGLITLPDQSPPGDEVDFHEAISRPLILPGRLHGLRKLVEAACVDTGLKPNVRVEADNLAMSKAFVTAGLGSTIYARSGIQSELIAGLLQYTRIERPRLQWKMSIAVRSNSIGSLAVQEMAKAIKADVAQKEKEGGWS